MNSEEEIRKALEVYERKGKQSVKGTKALTTFNIPDFLTSLQLLYAEIF